MSNFLPSESNWTSLTSFLSFKNVVTSGCSKLIDIIDSTPLVCSAILSTPSFKFRQIINQIIRPTANYKR